MTRPQGYEAVHAALTDAFPYAQTARDRARWTLTDEQVDRFYEHGFLLDLPLLDEEQVAELRSRLNHIGENIDELKGRLYEVEAAWQERPDEVVLHLLGAWLVDEWFHDLVFHPGVTVPLAQLLGVEELHFWHDQVFWKPPHHPGVVPWHQDYSYWTRTAPAQHITMFIALDDMSRANGCLHYVPGSQRWGLLPAVSFGGAADQLHEHLTRAQERAFEPVPVQLAAGRAAIHHSHMVHGSSANDSDRPRRAVVLNYMGPDVRVTDGSSPLLKGVPPIEEGEPVSGAFFPVVCRALQPRGS
jgi:ectoine hydroxylase-related dioxygenase (phytanoyl-CoA dioxygenase family)